MKGNCRACKKHGKCTKDIGFMYGFCYNGFDPIVPVELNFARKVTAILKQKEWYNFSDKEVIKCIREFFEEYGAKPLWAEFQNGDDEVKDGIAMMVWELATK